MNISLRTARATSVSYEKDDLDSDQIPTSSYDSSIDSRLISQSSNDQEYQEEENCISSLDSDLVPMALLYYGSPYSRLTAFREDFEIYQENSSNSDYLSIVGQEINLEVLNNLLRRLNLGELQLSSNSVSVSVPSIEIVSDQESNLSGNNTESGTSSPPEQPSVSQLHRSRKLTGYTPPYILSDQETMSSSEVQFTSTNILSTANLDLISSVNIEPCISNSPSTNRLNIKYQDIQSSPPRQDLVFKASSDESSQIPSASPVSQNYISPLTYLIDDMLMSDDLETIMVYLC